MHSSDRLAWDFPRTFWIANTIELFERAAFYGMFIALALYLTRRVGFSDVHAGYAAGAFSSVMYLLPPFSGALADKIGFRKALMSAFLLLAAGYVLLGAVPSKPVALLSLALIMIGGSIVKPAIGGTVAKCSDEDHRARAFSIFYLVVNIGATLGKFVAKPLRTGFVLPYVGQVKLGLDYINYYASVMALCAFLLVVLFYRDEDRKGAPQTFREVWVGFRKVVLHGRFMCLIVIIAGFWTIQGQLYATMPKYILRLCGEAASPEWLAIINPAVVVLLVIPVTHLVRRAQAENCILISLFIIAMSALVMSLSPLIESLLGGPSRIHPVVLAVAIGITLQAVAECFLSPKFMEFASRQAPRGEVGLYMGYTHLSTFLAWALGFAVSGHLLDAYCPEPATLGPEVQQQRLEAIATGSVLPAIYAHAHYVWYVFAGIGACAFLAITLFIVITGRVATRSTS